MFHTKSIEFVDISNPVLHIRSSNNLIAFFQLCLRHIVDKAVVVRPLEDCTVEEGLSRLRYVGRNTFS